MSRWKQFSSSYSLSSKNRYFFFRCLLDFVLVHCFRLDDFDTRLSNFRINRTWSRRRRNGRLKNNNNNTNTKSPRNSINRASRVDVVERMSLLEMVIVDAFWLSTETSDDEEWIFDVVCFSWKATPRHLTSKIDEKSQKCLSVNKAKVRREASRGITGQVNELRILAFMFSLCVFGNIATTTILLAVQLLPLVQHTRFPISPVHHEISRGVGFSLSIARFFPAVSPKIIHR